MPNAMVGIHVTPLPPLFNPIASQAILNAYFERMCMCTSVVDKLTCILVSSYPSPETDKTKNAI